MPDNRNQRLAVIAVALTLPTLVTWIYFAALRSFPAAAQQSAYVVGKAIQFSLPIVWVFISRRDDLRWSTPLRRGLVFGVGFGLLIGTAMVCLYAWGLKPAGFFEVPAEQVRAKVSGMGLTTPAKYAAVGVFYALCHSLLEEYYWRWFVFRELRRTASLPLATFVSCLGFMAHHVLVLATFFGWSSPATWIFSFAVAIGGAVWAWLYDRSQSLLGPWASHCLVDAAIFIIGFDLVRDTFK